MRKILPIIFLLAFILGIKILIDADTGYWGNMNSAHIAGSLICIFSGTYMGIYFHNKFSKE